jgi:hypothetical protein
VKKDRKRLVTLPGPLGQLLTNPGQIPGPTDSSVTTRAPCSPPRREPRRIDALCAPEPGKDAFHRVPDYGRNEWDAVERVLTILADRFRGRASPTAPLPPPLPAHRPLTTDYQLLPCSAAPAYPVSPTPAKPLLHVPAPEKHPPTHFPERQVLRPAVPVHRAYRHTQPVGHIGSAHHFIGPTLAGVSIMVSIFHARGMFSICNSLCASAFGSPLRLELPLMSRDTALAWGR